MKLVSQQRVSLKSNPNITEKMIQDYIYDNPSILGLGELAGRAKEKCQPSGGRIDMLFEDDENNRYEVELQLGATDPSHIIRTIEYWDNERKRYPQYNHTAVIIAEDITSRFQNVISLFNNQIPLIAIQLSATQIENGDIALNFVKIMDVVELATDEEETNEVVDRNYWERKRGKKILQLVDELFEQLGERKRGYELKYNKWYIGLSKNGISKNFIFFKPWNKFVSLRIKADENSEITDLLEQHGLDLNYDKRENCYKIKISKLMDYTENEEAILRLIDSAIERMGLM